MAPPLKRLALDTNILFDLASGEDFAHDFRETFQEHGYALWVPPTVVAELTYKASERKSGTQQLALAALQSLLSWGIRPYDLKAVGHGITEFFAKYLIRKGLLPDNEFHDGVILAETALGDIPILATSDKHLLNIEESDLKLAFDAQDLMQVTPLHPRNLRRALLKKKGG
jgi:predicted nucleic acid-binding protein